MPQACSITSWLPTPGRQPGWVPGWHTASPPSGMAAPKGDDLPTRVRLLMLVGTHAALVFSKQRSTYSQPRLAGRYSAVMSSGVAGCLLLMHRVPGMWIVWDLGTFTSCCRPSVVQATTGDELHSAKPSRMKASSTGAARNGVMSATIARRGRAAASCCGGTCAAASMHDLQTQQQAQYINCEFMQSCGQAMCQGSHCCQGN